MSTLISLENVRIASPCRADWNLMEGDDHVRFCRTCAKNVFNLSAMTKADAEKLLMEKEGNLCVRFYQREDGTVLTDNCPVGLKIVSRPFKWLAASFAAFLATGAAIAAQGESPSAISAQPTFNVRETALAKMIIERFEPKASPMMGEPTPIMGKPAPCPAPTPTPKPKE